LEQHFGIKAKVKGRRRAIHIEDTQQRLVTEIEMLKVVLYLVSRRKDSCSSFFKNK
jgi:uncharacterized protein YqeY